RSSASTSPHSIVDSGNRYGTRDIASRKSGDIADWRRKSREKVAGDRYIAKPTRLEKGRSCSENVQISSADPQGSPSADRLLGSKRPSQLDVSSSPRAKLRAKIQRMLDFSSSPSATSYHEEYSLM